MILPGGGNNEDAFLLSASVWSEVSFSETVPQEPVWRSCDGPDCVTPPGCKRGRAASSLDLKTVASRVP